VLGQQAVNNAGDSIVDGPRLHVRHLDALVQRADANRYGGW